MVLTLGVMPVYNLAAGLCEVTLQSAHCLLTVKTKSAQVATSKSPRIRTMYTHSLHAFMKKRTNEYQVEVGIILSR